MEISKEESEEKPRNLWKVVDYYHVNKAFHYR